MADNNLPASAGPDVTTLREPSYEEHVEDISKALLDDPETDLVEEQEDATAALEPEDDPLGLDAEDVAADDADNPDGPDTPLKGGRFAPDSAKVTMDDGTVTTIAELKRGTLFQRDYTRKTTELAAEKETVAADRQQVSQLAQQVEQLREYAGWYAENFLPKPPEPFKGAADDHLGFLEWQRKNTEWQAHAQAYQQFMQSRSSETQQQTQQKRQAEAEALGKAMPIFKDPVKGRAAWDALVSGAQHYNFSPGDIDAVVDHRMLLVLRDAIAYRRIKDKAPQAQAQAARRPPVREARRAPADQQATRQKQNLTEQLNKPGNFDAGVALLRNLNI